jgi:hypothetical protein
VEALTATVRRGALHPVVPVVLAGVIGAALLAIASVAGLPRPPLWVMLGAIAGYSISGSV